MSTWGIGSVGSKLLEGFKENSNSVSQDGFEKFGNLLSQALNEVNQLEKDSQSLTNDLAIGKTDNIHQVMIASEKASISLDLTMQIRNKALDAYNEIMRMQF